MYECMKEETIWGNLICIFCIPWTPLQWWWLRSTPPAGPRPRQLPASGQLTAAGLWPADLAAPESEQLLKRSWQSPGVLQDMWTCRVGNCGRSSDTRQAPRLSQWATTLPLGRWAESAESARRLVIAPGLSRDGKTWYQTFIKTFPQSPDDVRGVVSRGLRDGGLHEAAGPGARGGTGRQPNFRGEVGLGSIWKELDRLMPKGKCLQNSL